LAGTKTNATVHQPTRNEPLLPQGGGGEARGRGGSHGSAIYVPLGTCAGDTGQPSRGSASVPAAGAELDEFLPYQLSMTV